MADRKEIALPGRLRWVQRVAHLLDDSFRIPGTNFRFGLDPLLNLLPVAGDVSGFVVGALLVWVMARHGVSRKVLILMVWNLTVDAIIGGIPLIGYVTDFYFKANTRNLKLLQEHYLENRHNGAGTGLLITLLILVFVVFAFSLFAIYWVIHWVYLHVFVR